MSLISVDGFFFRFAVLFFVLPAFAAISIAQGSSVLPASAFFQSLIIIVREGFEAILIIGAIIAYLVVSKNENHVKTVYAGAVAAVIASLLTAFLFEQVFLAGKGQKEFLEGFTILFAAIVLLFVTNWMLSKVEAMRWQKYIKGKVQEAVSKSNPFALALVSFFAVYREGFETVLFFKALMLSSAAVGEIFAGFLVGAIILVVVFFATIKIGLKLPVNIFFLSTSVLLFFFAFSFAGSGIHELQEAGLLNETGFGVVPKIKLLGLYPTFETIFVQLLVLLFGLAMAYIHVFKHRDFAKLLSNDNSQ